MSKTSNMVKLYFPLKIRVHPYLSQGQKNLFTFREMKLMVMFTFHLLFTGINSSMLAECKRHLLSFATILWKTPLSNKAHLKAFHHNEENDALCVCVCVVWTLEWNVFFLFKKQWPSFMWKINWFTLCGTKVLVLSKQLRMLYCRVTEWN